jgi:hypothetical protein
MEHATELKAPRGLRASEAVSAALRKLIDERGEVVAVDVLGLSRPTMARLFGGLPVQPATLILAAARLGVDLSGTLG